MVTNEQKKAAIEVMAAVAGVIRELRTVPNGELYARCMGHMTFSAYTSIIEALKSARCITERNNVLTWIGPEKRTGV